MHFLIQREMLELAVRSKLPVVFMHMLKNPFVMQENPLYEDVVKDVKGFLKNRVDLFISYGGKKENIILDPGIGFGKKLTHNLTLLKQYIKSGYMNYFIGWFVKEVFVLSSTQS